MNFLLIPILMRWEYLKCNFFCKSIVILFLGRFISRKGDEAVQKVQSWASLRGNKEGLCEG